MCFSFEKGCVFCFRNGAFRTKFSMQPLPDFLISAQVSGWVSWRTLSFGVRASLECNKHPRSSSGTWYLFRPCYMGIQFENGYKIQERILLRYRLLIEYFSCSSKYVWGRFLASEKSVLVCF